MLIAVTEAAKRLGISSDSLARALKNKGVTLVHFNARALAVEESDLAAFLASRQDYSGKGRPRKRPAAD